MFDQKKIFELEISVRYRETVQVLDRNQDLAEEDTRLALCEHALVFDVLVKVATVGQL